MRHEAVPLSSPPQRDRGAGQPARPLLPTTMLSITPAARRPFKPPKRVHDEEGPAPGPAKRARGTRGVDVVRTPSARSLRSIDGEVHSRNRPEAATTAL